LSILGRRKAAGATFALNPHFSPKGRIMAPDFFLQGVLATED
jgi:hypothetical protein